ncbi:MAG: hypothetical protein RL477_2331, partial [Pseudomonadota bacterium]
DVSPQRYDLGTGRHFSAEDRK